MSYYCKRRGFLFGSLKSFLLFSPLFSLRQASAQSELKKRFVFFVDSNSYPRPEDFFPTLNAQGNLVLSPIFRDFSGLLPEMAFIEGVDIRDSGDQPRSTNHVRSMGKTLTAADVIEIFGGRQNATHGGPSIDQFIKQRLQLQSIELQCQDDLEYGENNMRDMPFAAAAETPVRPTMSPQTAWDIIFGDFSFPGADPETIRKRREHLLDRRSILDDLLPELARFKKEMSGPLEKSKLEIHETSIRETELKITNMLEQDSIDDQCEDRAGQLDDSTIPQRYRTMLDIIFTAFVCNRIDIGSLLFGRSNARWTQSWVPEWSMLPNPSVNTHEGLYHQSRRAENEVHIQVHVGVTRWAWNQIREHLVDKLKQVPEGAGNMFDNTLIYGTSHFGRHHQITNIPCVFMGGANIPFKKNQLIQVANTTNAKTLTSVAQIAGLSNVVGFGDEPNCGVIPGLI